MQIQTITETLKQYNEYKDVYANLKESYNRNDEKELRTFIMNYWYDWFCTEKSLLRKGMGMLNKLNAIADSPKIDKEKCYVWFKNNCPCAGSLYDDFRIADIETGDVVYTIIPASGHDADKGRAELWGRENNFNGPILTGKWVDIKRYFKEAK